MRSPSLLLALCGIAHPVSQVGAQAPPISFWLGDGDNATEDLIVTYDEVAGLGTIPLLDNNNLPWGYPGDFVRIGGIVYGVDTFQEKIYTIDEVAGVLTPISVSAGGAGWDTRLGSLAHDPVNNLLYSFSWQGSMNDLFIFDLNTLSWLPSIPDFPFSDVHGLAWHESQSLLYVYDAASGEIHTLDPQTSATAFVVAPDHSTGDFYDEIAFFEGHLYGTLHEVQSGLDVIQLRRIDLVTGDAVDIGPPIVDSDGHALLINSVPLPAVSDTYGAGCSGLALEVEDELIIGTNPNFKISGYPFPATPGGLTFVGFTRFDPGLPLAPIGAPGCFQYASLDSTSVFFTSGTQSYVPAIPGGIPNNANLAGMHVYGQSVAFLAGANPLGLIASNGVDMVLGF